MGQTENEALKYVAPDEHVGGRGWSENGRAHDSPLFQVLPKAFFLEQLRRERLRSDRSGAALSLIIVALKHDFKSGCRRTQELLGLLRDNLREVDSAGLLGPTSIAVMLPDTNSAGVQIVAEKFNAGADSSIESVATATYPDALFESLQGGGRAADSLDPTLFLNAPRPRPVQSVVKRAIDVLGAIVGLVLFSPLMLLTWLAIKLTSPGAAIFQQTRLGKDLKPFTFYKFRSMHIDSDDGVHRLYLEKLIKGDTDEVDRDASGKAFYKIKADSRVTRVGRIIRKTSIDELPQFFNVLKGDMSLVGPRPPIPYEAQNYRSWHLRRILEVKPGLTGPWQVGGRSETTFDEMVRMDLRYSNEWSVPMDIVLLFKTIRVVLEGRGAA